MQQACEHYHDELQALEAEHGELMGLYNALCLASELRMCDTSGDVQLDSPHSRQGPPAPWAPPLVPAGWRGMSPCSEHISSTHPEIALQQQQEQQQRQPQHQQLQQQPQLEQHTRQHQLLQQLQQQQHNQKQQQHQSDQWLSGFVPVEPLYIGFDNVAQMDEVCSHKCGCTKCGTCLSETPVFIIHQSSQY